MPFYIRRNILIVSFLLLDLFAQRSWASDALFQQTFITDSGFPASVASLQTEGKDQILFLFWAGWCVPCKEELHLVAETGKSLTRTQIIAVNIDDSSGWSKAQAFLAGVKWPYLSLRDDGGQFFYSYHAIGQLPLAVLLDAKGNRLQMITKLDAAVLAGLEVKDTVAGDEGKNVKGSKLGSLSLLGAYRQFRGDNDIRRRISAGSATGRFSTGVWEGQVKYDILGQRQENPNTSISEDEIGFSYVQAKLGDWSLRGGDDYLSIMGGRLFSAQNLRGSTETSSVLGGHAKWVHKKWSVLAFGGRVRMALFPSQINPAQDVSVTLPRETAQGVQTFWSEEVGSRKLEFNLNYVNYHREKDETINYFKALNDNRFGGSVYWGTTQTGTQIQYASYQPNTPALVNDSEKPYLVQPWFWWTPPHLENLYLNLHYLEYQSLPTRTLLPVLVEDPGLPLSVVKKRSFKLAPRYSSNENVWSLEPYWIYEQSIYEQPNQKQNSYGFTLTVPKRDLKFVALRQDARLSPVDTYTESGLLFNTAIVGPLATQMNFKDHKSASNRGDSYGVLLGLDVSRAFDWNRWGQWNIQSQWTHQSGYYLGFSGIARKDLASFQISWIRQANSVKLSFGSEPGGLVCTNGVCLQKPPMNGVAVDVGLTF